METVQLQQPQQLPPPPPPPAYTVMDLEQPPHNSCCAGQAPRFNVQAGRVTGSIQLVFGLLCIVLPLIPIVLVDGVHWYPGIGDAPGTAILVFIPAGILGMCSKSRSKCVVISYLVMSILSACSCLGVVAYESIAAAVFSYTYTCSGWICGWELEPGVVALHALTALVGMAEFVVAIVASVYCCRGLGCCRNGCHCGDEGGVPANTMPTSMATPTYYNPTPQQGGFNNEVQYVVKY